MARTWLFVLALIPIACRSTGGDRRTLVEVIEDQLRELDICPSDGTPTICRGE